MKYTNKKRGFTIVELIIVIAVIGILAAVLIPTFSSLIRKAQVAADETLIKNLNTALSMDTTVSKHETMTQALEATKANGFDVEKIEARATDNKIVWDSLNDCFAYIEKEKSEPTYIPDTKRETPEKFQLWTIVNSLTLDKDYSSFIAGNSHIGEITATGKGVDVGENTGITTVTYNANGNTKYVVLRTNSFGTSVTVNDGKVNHYGNVANATVATGEYNEYGSARVLTLTDGTLNVQSNANVTLVNAKKGSVEIKGEVEVLVADSGVDTKGTAKLEAKTTITDNTVAIVGSGKDVEAKDTLGETDLQNKTAVLLKDLPDTTIYVLSNTTIIGNMVKIKAKVIGTEDVTLKNVNTTNITVGEDGEGTGFSGTLTFDGGTIGQGTTGTSDENAPMYIGTKSDDGSYVFKNMTLSTGATKGIKIKSAKSVVIENCVFNAKTLNPNASGEEYVTRSLSAIDIDISNDTCNMDLTIKGCTFANVPFASEKRDDTAGAIKIKSQKKGKFGKVVIENNTFINCCRDIVIGKADAGTDYHTRTFNDKCQAWTIRNNTSDITSNMVKEISVLTKIVNNDKESKQIGKMVGGCAVFDVAQAYEDRDTYAVKFN